MRILNGSSLLPALLGLALVGLGLTGCSTEPVNPEAGTNETNMGVTASALKKSDVDQMRFVVRKCGSSTIVEQGTSDLLPMSLPGGIPSLEGKPYDKDSEHAFSDKYFLLDTGCYDVTVTPLQSNGRPSQKCDAAKKTGIQVEDGETTEVLLISQCKGPERGGLDVLGSINHPPELDDIQFFPSKFVKCPERVKICLTATDPDDDPLRAEFEIKQGPQPLSPVRVVKKEDRPGYLKRCYSFIPGQGSWKLSFTVWDRVWYQGNQIDVEQYLRRVQKKTCGPQNQHFCQSRDSLHFPLYGSECPNGQPDVGVDTGQPDTDIPDTGQPDTGQPDTDIPDTGQPDTGQPDTGQPDTGQPDTGQPDTGQPDTGQPDTGQPDTGQPDTGQPICGNGILEAGEECDGEGQAQCEAGEVCVECQCEPEQFGCTRTRGYWSTHHEFATAPGLIRDWPAPEDEQNQLCSMDWLDILNTPAQGRAWFILAAQYIAAKLNVAAGASTTPTVAQAISDAEQLLTNNCSGIPSNLEQTALDVKDILDEYNNGLRGPGECRDTNGDTVLDGLPQYISP